MRVSWNASGERFYETGVDQGVLYVGTNPGVPWLGLISVEESPSGGEARPYYQDGIKFANISAKEEFEATINAFTAPREFGPCDGTVSMQKGLFVTQQPRRAFSLCYRTKIGNDVQGQNLGYKLHLVYNALAAPSDRSHSTLGESVDPNTLSWQITTLPPSLTGLKPTAHFVVDSRYTPNGLLEAIEAIVYGSDAADARMPLVSELVALFQSEGPLTRQNLFTNPNFSTALAGGDMEVRRNLVSNPNFTYSSATGEMRRNRALNAGARINFNYWNCTLQSTGTPALSQVAVGGPVGVIDSFVRMTVTAVTTGLLPSTGVIFGSPSADNMTGVPGSKSTMSVYTRCSVADRTSQLVITAHDSSGGGQEVVYTGPSTPIGAGWVRLSGTFVVPIGKPRLYARIYSVGGRAWQVGDTMDATAVLNEVSEYLGSWFDGQSVFTNGLTGYWVGTANASDSQAIGARPWNWANKVGTSMWVAPDGGSWVLHPVVNDAAAILYQTTGDIPIPQGEKTIHTLTVTSDPNNSPFQMQMDALVYEVSAPVTRTIGVSQVVQPGQTVTFVTVSPAATTVGAVARSVLYGAGIGIPAGTKYKLTHSIVEAGEVSYGPYFDGSFAPNDGLTYSWVGTPNASASIAKGKRPAGWYIQATGGSSIRIVPGGMVWLRKSTASYLAITSLSATITANAGKYLTIAFDLDAALVAQLEKVVVTFTGVVTITTSLLPDTTRQVVSFAIPEGATGSTIYLPYPGQGTAGEIRMSNLMISVTDGPSDGSFFSGNSLDEDNNFYSWEGEVDNSISDLHTWN